MKRVLILDAGVKGSMLFTMARTALLGAGDGKGERKRDRVRKEARLLQALDAISEPMTAEEPEGERRLKAEGGTLTLAAEDHALLAEYIDSTPWLPRAAIQAVETQDWIEAAAKVED